MKGFFGSGNTHISYKLSTSILNTDRAKYATKNERTVTLLPSLLEIFMPAEPPRPLPPGLLLAAFCASMKDVVRGREVIGVVAPRVQKCNFLQHTFQF